MKKYIINLLYFTLFTLIFYITAIVLWGYAEPTTLNDNLHYTHSSTFERLKEIGHIKNPDILFLGSSHAYQGFDTRIFNNHGLNTFILGTTAQTPIQTLVLLDRYLDKIKPKSVVFEVNPLSFSSDGIESALDIISDDKNDFHSYKMAIQYNQIKTYNTLVYAQFKDWFSLNKSFTKSIGYIEGGFAEYKDIYYKPSYIEKKVIIIPKNQMDAFEKCINKIKSKNIEVILVYAPISHNLYSSYANNEYFDNEMKKYSEYYNFNELINLTDTFHFRDSHHLNQNGVVLFNQKLIKILSKKNARTHNNMYK